MLVTRLPRPVRLGLYALAVAILLWLCLAPSDELPQPGVGDKWQHGVAWLVLMLTGLTLSSWRPRAIAAFAFGLGVAVEILQATMGFGRDGDWRDLVADTAGIAVGLALAWVVRRALRSRHG
jgi:VanZ family protein